jgi:hypothetical protein
MLLAVNSLYHLGRRLRKPVFNMMLTNAMLRIHKKCRNAHLDDQVIREKSLHASKIGANVGIPLDSSPKTIFRVTTGLEMTKTASALESLYKL